MSSAREEILARIRAALVDVPAEEPAHLPPPRDYETGTRLAGEEITARFCERVGEYRARVCRVRDHAVASAVGEVLTSHGARRIGVPPDLPEHWLPDSVEPVRDQPPLTPEELDTLDGVITGAALAIAETGTIVLDGGRHQGRRALSLVPDLHVCLVDPEEIVATVPQAVARLEPRVRDQRRPLTFISGPSATSDIEFRRVEGVHGPRRLEVIVLG